MAGVKRPQRPLVPIQVSQVLQPGGAAHGPVGVLVIMARPVEVRHGYGFLFLLPPVVLLIVQRGDGLPCARVHIQTGCHGRQWVLYALRCPEGLGICIPALPPIIACSFLLLFVCLATSPLLLFRSRRGIITHGQKSFLQEGAIRPCPSLVYAFLDNSHYTTGQGFLQPKARKLLTVYQVK